MAQTGTNYPQTRISGQIIIDEVIRNMELGRLEMGYSILLPCIFSIYLHPDDYARIAGVQEIIKEDARRVLSARLAEWNRGSVFRKGRGGSRKDFRIAQNDWSIEFYADTEGSVPAGDVEIHSELNDVAQPGYRGVKTTLIEREPSVTSLRVAARPRPAAPLIFRHAPPVRGLRRDPVPGRFGTADLLRHAKRNQHRPRRRRPVGRSAALHQRRGFPRAPAPPPRSLERRLHAARQEPQRHLAQRPPPGPRR